MLRFATDRPAPEIPPARLESTGLRRLMVGAAGAQYLVRAAHVPGTRPLLLLHDLFRSSWTHEPDLRAAHRTIVAPDLPGCGDSDALAEPPSVAGFASALLGMLDALGRDVEAGEAGGVRRLRWRWRSRPVPGSVPSGCAARSQRPVSIRTCSPPSW
jgi:hypothetical protein